MKPLVKAKLSIDGFFERGVGGRAAGLLADLRFNIWRRAHPNGTYAEFYAHRVSLRLKQGGAHKTLGLRHYRADPVAGAVVHDEAGFATRGFRYFRWFERRSLRPDMVCVDYGCGSLRVGQHFIRYLDPGHYLGLDVVDRFYEDGLTLIDPATVAAKRPYFSAIDPSALDLAARRNPDLIYSTAVLQHVPPDELDHYFRAIVAMMGRRCVAIANFKRSRKTERIGSSAWTHEPAELAAAVRRVDPSMLVQVENDPEHHEDRHPQAMLILAREPVVLAAWSSLS